MKKMLLIDGNSLLFRAYHATAFVNMMKTSNGIPTNAVYGFAGMINKAMELIQPDYVLVAWDTGKPTFRHKEYPAYKGTRKPVDEELIIQFDMAREFLDSYGIKRYEEEGIEADDIIGSMVKTNQDININILTSDRDLLQLIDDTTSVWLLIKGMSEIKKMDEATLLADKQISPKQVCDLKGIMGDSADNIPGVKGIGEVGATKLLVAYGTLENVYDHIEEIKGKLKEKLINDHDIAILSKHLATINTSFNIPFTLDNLIYKKNELSLNEFYIKYEMRSYVNKNIITNHKNEITYTTKVVKVISEEMLSKDCIIMLDYDNEDYYDATVYGLGIINNNIINYISIEDLKQDSLILNYLKNNKEKITYDCKTVYHLFKKENIECCDFKYDINVMAFLLDSTINSDELFAQTYEFDNTINKDEIYGKKGKPKLPLDEERIEYTYSYLKGYKRIFKELFNNLEKKEMLPLLYDIEMPLTKVLYEMEENGVCVDANILASIAKDCEFRINNLEKEIFDLVGHSFNINSPKQLAEVLFDELNIPTTKKRSTGIDILNKNINIHPIFKLVIEHRKYSKLYSTYAIGLSKHIQSDNKIHTIYKQCYTQTGRLSSVEPNLQNISVRNEEGREIRKAFKASPGCVLLGSDYSQIELRILAHMANEDKMQEAFINSNDIHTLTASNMFNVDINEVSSNMRRQAKAINFGIVYGMSVFGLSEQLNISNYDAKEFIDKYNETYPNIEKFMNETIEFCEKNGYVKTMFNRRRDIKEINEKGFMKKEFGKRAAMNAPIQGTAADLIKVAMVKVNEEIHKRNLKSKMILQIHDELIFDVDKSEIEVMKEIVKDSMENAMVLKVPLVASQSIADTWYDCK